MSPQEAKFILRAYRSDGRYSGNDPLFADALGETERDSALHDWFTREQAVDATLANKIDAVQPPADLRESILVGARASRLRPRLWLRPWTMAAAAAVLIVVVGLLTIPVVQVRVPFGPSVLARASMDDLAHVAHSHELGPAVATLAAQLSKQPLPFNASISIEPEAMRRAGCHNFKIAGRDVFEICFEREGTWYHLYVARADNAPRRTAASHPTIVEQGATAAAAWADAHHVYALTTWAGADALRKLF